jgi:hypothetical protein
VSEVSEDVLPDDDGDPSGDCAGDAKAEDVAVACSYASELDVAEGRGRAQGNAQGPASTLIEGGDDAGGPMDVGPVLHTVVAEVLPVSKPDQQGNARNTASLTCCRGATLRATDSSSDGRCGGKKLSWRDLNDGVSIFPRVCRPPARVAGVATGTRRACSDSVLVRTGGVGAENRESLAGRNVSAVDHESRPFGDAVRDASFNALIVLKYLRICCGARVNE